MRGEIDLRAARAVDDRLPHPGIAPSLDVVAVGVHAGDEGASAEEEGDEVRGPGLQIGHVLLAHGVLEAAQVRPQDYHRDETDDRAGPARQVRVVGALHHRSAARIGRRSGPVKLNNSSAQPQHGAAPHAGRQPGPRVSSPEKGRTKCGASTGRTGVASVSADPGWQMV